MRLWHKELIPYLPRQQLLGQWRECCAIARNMAEDGTPNHVLVNKVLDYPVRHFWSYGRMIHDELKERGYMCDWKRFSIWFMHLTDEDLMFVFPLELFPDWHNNWYLKQCLYNLQEKADCGAIPAEEWKKITDRWPEFK